MIQSKSVLVFIGTIICCNSIGLANDGFQEQRIAVAPVVFESVRIGVVYQSNSIIWNHSISSCDGRVIGPVAVEFVIPTNDFRYVGFPFVVQHADPGVSVGKLSTSVFGAEALPQRRRIALEVGDVVTSGQVIETLEKGGVRFRCVANGEFHDVGQNETFHPQMAYLVTFVSGPAFLEGLASDLHDVVTQIADAIWTKLRSHPQGAQVSKPQPVLNKDDEELLKRPPRCEKTLNIKVSATWIDATKRWQVMVLPNAALFHSSHAELIPGDILLNSESQNWLSLDSLVKGVNSEAVANSTAFRILRLGKILRLKIPVMECPVHELIIFPNGHQNQWEIEL